MKILKYLNIIIFSLTVLFSFNLYSEEKTIRIVSKDLDSTDMDYINIGVEALKIQGIHIKVEVVELVGGQSYKEKLPLSINTNLSIKLVFSMFNGVWIACV